MFVRFRWFVLGFVTAAVAGLVVVRRARAMKERLDAEGLARVAASFVADVVEAAGLALQRSAVEAPPAVSDEATHATTHS